MPAFGKVRWAGSLFAALDAVATARGGQNPHVDELGRPRRHQGPRWSGDMRGPAPDPLVPRIEDEVQSRGDQHVEFFQIQELLHSRIRHSRPSPWTVADLLDAGPPLEIGARYQGYPHWRYGVRGLVGCTWLAAAHFLREVCHLRAPQATWDLLEALTAASGAGPWWVLADHVVIADRPDVVCTDENGRLHCLDGPVLRWADGSEVYGIDGVRVPADLVTSGWSPAAILGHGNVAVRRVAIERLGWARFAVEAGLALVDGPVSDPANPGRELLLYQLPRDLLGGDYRLLVCTNATPERDGTVASFGLRVPVAIPDALAAAAWTFDVGPEAYRQLVRAT